MKKFPIQVSGRGPTDASIVIVGEAPGADEVKAGQPFVGASGKELERMLGESGIDPDSVYYTNVFRTRPPGNKIDEFFASSKTKAKKLGYIEHRGKYLDEELLEHIELLRRDLRQLQPNVIVPVGNTPLWALTGDTGITKWRGSELWSSEHMCKIIPTYHPAAILRQWAWRNITVHDFCRIEANSHSPTYPELNNNFLVAPTFKATKHYLEELLDELNNARQPIPLAVDLETFPAFQLITCLGIATSPKDAICIPLISTDRPAGYFSVNQEAEITFLLNAILSHKFAHIIGQNFMYDSQYLTRCFGVVPHLGDDTMIQQHIAFPGQPKALHYLASMYCERYTYWKDEAEHWNPNRDDIMYWTYCCKDVCATFEVWENLSSVLQQLNLVNPYAEKLDEFYPALWMTLRGMRTDENRRRIDANKMLNQIAERERWLKVMLGISINFNSPKQKAKLFYDILKLPKQYNVTKGVKRLTTDAKAIAKLISLPTVDPIFKPILQCFADLGSISTMLSTFAKARIDHDKRWRCEIQITGAETMRWSTRADAFGLGSNMQNLSKGGKG